MPLRPRLRCGTSSPVPLPTGFDRVGKFGRDDGPAGGKGIDEHARGDLVGAVVGQHHHRRVRDECAEIVERARYFESKITRLATPRCTARSISNVAVPITLAIEDLRMGLSGHDVAGDEGGHRRSSPARR